MDSRTGYFETHSHDPFYNLAFEEVVLRGRKEGNYLILWQNDRTVVVGQNQNTEAEINRSFVEAHDIRVVRRSTGGGAVYHDLGNLNYSFITDAGEAERLSMEVFTRPVVEALKGLGLEAEATGRNDILVNGSKVSGTAQRLSGGRILHHGTLLFDSDPDMVAGALNVDPSKFQSKSSKSVRSRIGSIRSHLGEDMDLQTFWSYLKNTLAGSGFYEVQLTEQELAEVERLRRENMPPGNGTLEDRPGLI
jgi:lipoate-protein ligase A